MTATDVQLFLLDFARAAATGDTTPITGPRATVDDLAANAAALIAHLAEALAIERGTTTTAIINAIDLSIRVDLDG